MNKYLLPGATVLISVMGSFLGTMGYDWINTVNTDRALFAHDILQLQDRAHYVSGDIPAAPVAAPAPRTRELAAEATK